MQRLTKALKERARQEIKNHHFDPWGHVKRFKYRGEEFIVDYSWDSPDMLQLYEVYDGETFAHRFGEPFPKDGEEK